MLVCCAVSYIRGRSSALNRKKKHEKQSDCSILFFSNIKITDLKMIKFKLREFLHQGMNNLSYATLKSATNHF